MSAPSEDPEEVKYPLCTETIPSVRSFEGAQNGIFCRGGNFLANAAKFSRPEL
jgi:hypothetical protein